MSPAVLTVALPIVPALAHGQTLHLKRFDSLAGRNARAAFQQMEWE